jgi:hypothetical protein
MSSRVSDKLEDVVCQVLALLEIALICVCSGTYTKEMPEPFQLYAGTGARVVALLLRAYDKTTKVCRTRHQMPQVRSGLSVILE